MFYQNGHQPPPYGQQPPYPQQNNLHYGGYHGGGVGSASASSASGDAILEFPSPYGGPPPIFGGGYAPSGPPAGNTYGAPQQQSTYAPMPHFTPQQPQPQPSNPPVQQPAPPPAGGKPLFQPSGMIRSRKPVTVSAPMESVLSPPSSANSAAASPSSPVPPLAASASASMPLVPSLSSDYEDYSLASAPPAYYQAYGPPAQNYGQQAPSHEYQVAPDIYRVTAPPPYQPQQQQPQQQQPTQQQQQPTPYHNMPILPQHRLYPSFSAPGLLNEHTQQQQQQHFPSSPQVPPQQQQQQQQQHYHPAPQLSQSQPQISHHYQPAPQLQPQPQQQAAAADETKPGSAAAAATGMKVLPPLPDRRRNTVNLSPRQQRLKEQQQKLQQPQRVSSDPSPQHQMSELEEKLRDRENKAKRRESVNVVVVPRRQLAGLSLNVSAPPTSTDQPLRAAAAAAAGPEEKRRGSGPPAPYQASSVAPTTTTAAATVEDLYVAPPSFVLQPESRRPLSTGGGASQKEPETQEDYNYYDLRSVHDSDSEEEDSDDDDGKGEASGGGGDAEANYVANIELKVASADSPLPSGYALPASGEWPAKVKAKPEGDKAVESPKVKGPMRQSAKRGNRWEIEFEELEVDKRIGQGAYGSVFKGKWRNTVVAIKTIRENMASFHEAKFKEFRGEAEMMMDMRPHTNVVQLFGVCMRPYMAIVVEFLEGGSLQELLQSKADIDLHMALKIALHAAAGVAHLHAEGICHRDLAARNLLLTSRNKDYLVVKVADFGLSRFTEDAEDNFTSCKVGPLKWMPPESLQEQKYSSKSDAWAMGVVLWEIFSRQEPFPGVSPVQVAIGVSSRGMCLRPPSSCPPEIARLMYDCWAYDPKERPDFRTIARTIEQVLDSNPENYNIVPNTGEPISCTHPKREGPTKPAPPPRRPTTTGQ